MVEWLRGVVIDEHERLREALVAHAVGALDPADLARLERHLPACAACTRLLAEHRAVLDLLPRALPPTPPPPRARAALLARVRDGSAPPRIAPAGRLRRFLERVQPVRWAAVTTALAGLLFWNVQLQRQLALPRYSPDVAVLATSTDGRVLELDGTGTPDASARLYLTPDRQHAELAVAGLPPLPRSRTYQLWFALAGEPTVSGGTFQVDARGQALAYMTMPEQLDQVTAIAVTEEPSPGSAAPTGQHLLDGTRLVR